MEFECNDDFEKQFDEKGFPYKHGHNGLLVFIIGKSLRLTIDFNPEYFNLYPRVKLLLNNEKETEVFDVGSNFSYRFIHQEVDGENVDEAFNHIQGLINDIEYFARRLSIQDLNEDKFKKKVSLLFEKNKFYYS